MPQPVPGPARTLLPERPDPEAELLRALGRRDASSCLRLVQHLVHRRGVAAMATLQRRTATLDTDALDWAWLDQLLAAETIAAAPRSTLDQTRCDPLERPAATAPMGAAPARSAAPPLAAAASTELAADPEAAMARTTQPAMAAPVLNGSTAELGAMETGTAVGLSRLAKTGDAGALQAVPSSVAPGPIGADPAAAADAPRGFAALDSDPEPAVLAESEPAPAVAMAPGAAAEPVPAPEHGLAAEQDEPARPSGSAAPRPLMGKLELNQRAVAAVDAAFEALAAEFPGYGLQPVDGPAASIAFDASLEGAAPPQDLEEPPAEELFSDPQLVPTQENRPRTRFSFVIPQPLQSQPNAAETTEQDQPWGHPESAGPEPQHAPQAEQAEAQPARGLWQRAEGRMASLRERVRGRLSLSGVKTLVRDCVEEAVSSLQGPAPVGEPGPTAGTDPQSQDQLAAAPTDPWSLQQPLPDPQGSSALSGHQAPIAAFGPPLGGDGTPPLSTAAAAPARLSPAQQVRQRLLGRHQPESRPAPAPQALSDLRAWLAADDDLPRAS